MKPCSRRRAERIASTTLAIFIERWPRCFGKAQPLKVGIGADIIAALPDLKPHAVGTALHAYVRSPEYLARMIEGTGRVDLDGKVVGIVTAAEAARARSQAGAARARARNSSRVVGGSQAAA